jgi:hypothetical protein
MKFFAYTLTLVLSLCCGINETFGQTPVTSPGGDNSPNGSAITANFAFGEVMTLDAAKRQIDIRTGQGTIAAQYDDKTKFVRVPPGTRSLENATPITLADVAVGDIVMARGTVSQDKKLIQSRQIILMSKSAIAQKREREREEWGSRGIVGRVTAINPATKEVSALVRAANGEQPITILASQSAFRRYAPDSIRFGDAKPSTFETLAVNDQLRARGQKSADGTKFNAEEIVSGSFRMVGGAITSIDPAKREITINDIPTKKPLVIVVNENSTLRRIPPEMVAALNQKTAAAGSGTASPASGAKPGEGDIQEMFDRLPVIAVSDLKAGDMILVASSAGASPSQVTAVMLAAGLEPLFNRPQPRPGNRPQVGAVGLPSGVFDGIIGTP